jgi:predicted DNA-binding ribbon-helix-helix protein
MPHDVGLPESTERSAASTLINRNIVVEGHRTSVRLERAMWDALHEIAEREGRTLNELATEISRQRRESSLTAAIRVFIVLYWRGAAAAQRQTPNGLSAQGPL